MQGMKQFFPFNRINKLQFECNKFGINYSKEFAMKECLVSLRRAVASGLILAITILPLPSAMAQSGAGAVENVEGFGPLPESPAEKAQRDGYALPLSLTEVTKMALQNNLNIAIQNLQEENQRLSLVSAYNFLEPSISFGSISFRSGVTVTADPSNPTNEFRNTSETASFPSVSITKRFLWGGQVSGSMSPGSRTERKGDQLVNNPWNNPSYSGGSLSINYSQQLWRNFRIDQQRNSIRVANLNLETNEISFKNQVTSVIASVQQQYWQLLAAIRNYDIQRNALRMAQINLRDNRKRLEVGTIPNINVIQGENALSSREVSMVSAENQIMQAQNALRQTVSSDRNSEIWGKFIIPTDLPDFVEYKIDIETAIATALQNRSEIESARLSLKQNEWTTELSRENKKWGVNFTASYGRSGATVYPEDSLRPCTPNPITGECAPSNTLTGGLPTAIKTIFSQPGYSWSVSFSITPPLLQAKKQNDITIAQNEIQRRNQLISLRQTEQNIQVQVTNAVQSLESARLSVEASERALAMSQLEFENQQKRYDVGMIQNDVLLTSMNNVSSAEYSVLQSLISYKQAIVTLQQQMNTLLESSQFTLARGNTVNNIPDLVLK